MFIGLILQRNLRIYSFGPKVNPIDACNQEKTTVTQFQLSTGAATKAAIGIGWPPVFDRTAQAAIVKTVVFWR